MSGEGTYKAATRLDSHKRKTPKYPMAYFDDIEENLFYVNSWENLTLLHEFPTNKNQSNFPIPRPPTTTSIW